MIKISYKYKSLRPISALSQLFNGKNKKKESVNARERKKEWSDRETKRK